MKYNIYNYEEQEEGVLLGCIETDLKGRATLHLGGDGKGAKRDYDGLRHRGGDRRGVPQQ